MGDRFARPGASDVAFGHPARRAAGRVNAVPPLPVDHSGFGIDHASTVRPNAIDRRGHCRIAVGSTDRPVAAPGEQRPFVRHVVTAIPSIGRIADAGCWRTFEAFGHHVAVTAPRFGRRTTIPEVLRAPVGRQDAEPVGAFGQDVIEHFLADIAAAARARGLSRGHWDAQRRCRENQCEGRRTARGASRAQILRWTMSRQDHTLTATAATAHRHVIARNPRVAPRSSRSSKQEGKANQPRAADAVVLQQGGCRAESRSRMMRVGGGSWGRAQESSLPGIHPFARPGERM